MCGICGIVDFSGRKNAETVRRMNDSLRHRGPDAGGIVSFGNCALGHRRLSIIDLSESANQPMLSECGRFALVFNGEIYNFIEIRDRLQSKGIVFRTRSDTEVLLHLYIEKQESMLEDLNGMFSFAIWDEMRRRLFTARDRVGKKPFYYYSSNGKLCFASELHSLIQDDEIPGDLHNQALFEYLMYDFIPGDHSIFKAVRKLPPAHYGLFDSDGFHVRSYWRPPTPEKRGDYEAASGDLALLLEDAVDKRLISDVPLGSFLSGGIDSSLVTALMGRNVGSRRTKTFSISFPGTSHDESKWSNMVAGHLGTDHDCRPVDYDISGVFSSMIKHFGEPFGDSSAIPTWHLCRHTREHVTVALSGDGGDELFGGYERYLARRLQTVYECMPVPLRERVIEPLIDLLPATTDYYGTSLSKKLKLFIQASGRMLKEPLAVIPRTFSRGDVLELTGIEYVPEIDPVISAAREWMHLDPVSGMMMTDLQTYLAEDILTKVDRMSMAHALEVRSPLLDYRIIEFACRLPLIFKIRRMTTKRILRDVAVPFVPKPVLERSKYGFQVPLGGWLKTSLSAWAREKLFNYDHQMFDRNIVETLWKEHLEGRADHAHKIWLILVFNEWWTRLYASPSSVSEGNEENRHQL